MKLINFQTTDLQRGTRDMFKRNYFELTTSFDRKLVITVGGRAVSVNTTTGLFLDIEWDSYVRFNGSK